MGIETGGFEVKPWLAAVEEANWQAVGEMVRKSPEDRVMLGWAAANLLSDKLNFRTAAAMVFEKSPVELEPEVVDNLQTAMNMETGSDKTLEARYYAAKALVEHEVLVSGVEPTVKEAAGCDDPELTGLALECLDVIEQIKQKQKK